MELILLVIGAGVIGYFLAGSKLSDGIDKTADKAVDVTKDAAGKAGGWVRGLFRRSEPAEEIVDAEFVEPEEPEVEETPEEPKPARKRASRRKTADE